MASKQVLTRSIARFKTLAGFDSVGDIQRFRPAAGSIGDMAGGGSSVGYSPRARPYRMVKSGPSKSCLNRSSTDNAWLNAAFAFSMSELTRRLRQTSSSPVGGWKIVIYLSISALGISNAPSGRFRFRSSKRRYNSEYGTSIKCSLKSAPSSFALFL